MMNKEIKTALINLCFEAESENYNYYWLLGFKKLSAIKRQEIMKFLAETDTLTQRLYLELCYME